MVIGGKGRLGCRCRRYEGLELVSGGVVHCLQSFICRIGIAAGRKLGPVTNHGLRQLLLVCGKRSIMRYFGVGFDKSCTPEMIDTVGAAQNKLRQVMSTKIDCAGHNWWDVIKRSHPAINSIGYSVGHAEDQKSLVPYLVIMYNPRLPPPSKEQILSAKRAETTLGDWLITNGLGATTLVIKVGGGRVRMGALREYKYSR